MFFYVGNEGQFDYMVLRCLRLLSAKYTHIRFAVVLSRMPVEKERDYRADYFDTIYPLGLEKAPPKFAIDRRNRWMLEQADCVVTYVRHQVGGAWKYKALAEKKGKVVFNLADWKSIKHFFDKKSTLYE